MPLGDGGAEGARGMRRTMFTCAAVGGRDRAKAHTRAQWTMDMPCMYYLKSHFFCGTALHKVQVATLRDVRGIGRHLPICPSSSLGSASN